MTERHREVAMAAIQRLIVLLLVVGVVAILVMIWSDWMDLDPTSDFVFGAFMTAYLSFGCAAICFFVGMMVQGRETDSECRWVRVYPECGTCHREGPWPCPYCGDGSDSQ